MKRGRAIALLLAPFLVACGALLGAEWEATLRDAPLDGAPGREDADPEGGSDPDGGRDSADQADARDAADAYVPGTCRGKADHCFCAAHDPADPAEGGVVCSIKAAGGGTDFCCADKSWPLTGKCQCATFNCGRSQPDFCMCGSGDAGTPAACSGALCCYSPDVELCSCYDTGTSTCPFLSDHEVRVGTCSLSTIPCGPNEKRVESCGVVTR